MGVKHKLQVGLPAAQTSNAFFAKRIIIGGDILDLILIGVDSLDSSS